MTTIHELATGLLEAVAAAVPDIARAYVHAGQIVDDEACANGRQLVVSWTGLRRAQAPQHAGTTGGGPAVGTSARMPAQPMVTLEVRLTVCVPADTPPSPEALTASAREVTDLAALVYRAVNGWLRTAPCSLATFRPVVPIGPAGAAGGLSWGLEVSVDSLEPTAS